MPGLRLPVCVLALLCGAFPLFGQQRGEIRLQVKDPSGAAMEAAGRLVDARSGAAHAFQTDAQGRATLADVQYGSYRLEVTRTGFSAPAATLVVNSAAPVERTITMALGSAAFNVEVVGVTPLAGTELPVEQMPTPVQLASSKDMDQSGALDLSDFLNRRLNGVHINENQGNPFQPDVNYRGYTASPLLGTPQGLSVYVDGVRLNQPFGDLVAWDLIPRTAIAEMALMPGSNPLFGLNTLGGALSVTTKDGTSAPGTAIQATGGSYGRRAVEFEQGGAGKHGLDWYLTGNLFHDDGWRTASASDVKQTFGRLGWQHGTTQIGLGISYADNTLNGNGLQEQGLLAHSYSSVYTVPDTTKDRSPFLNLMVRHAASSDLTFSGNVYFRYIRADAVNANLNTNSLDQSLYALSAADVAALKSAGYTGYPTGTINAANTPFPSWRCIAQALQLADPSDRCNGLLIKTWTKQHNYGFSEQANWLTSPGKHDNQLTAGVAWDLNGVTFQQTQQFAYLNPDRSLTTVPAFADGSTSAGGVPVDARVNLHGTPGTFSLYATDTMSLTSRLSLNVAGRFNRTTIDNTDRLPVAADGVRGSLNGHYVFSRFNPAAGMTFRVAPSVNLYGSYSEANRAPTSIELGCADPNNPCNLPNALAGDPPLNQVVARTVEAGVRGSREDYLHWSAGWFFTENHNDILFVASQQTGNGYFKNFGRTRRQGAEANVRGRLRRIELGGGYTFLRATYETAETVGASWNSTNDGALAGSPGLGGVIAIQPGDRIPLIPQHVLKAFAEYQPMSKVSLDLDFLAVSRSFARGNENNLDQAGGTYYPGPGTSPGYGVVNLGGHYQVNRHVKAFVEINNLLDHRYYTAAQLGPEAFNSQGNFVARPYPAVSGNYPLAATTFYAPGAPIRIAGGLRFTF